MTLAIPRPTPITPRGFGPYPAVEARLAEEAPAAESPSARAGVGGLLRRRIKYIARFIFWTVRHRSTKHVRWVLAFEGISWK